MLGPGDAADELARVQVEQEDGFVRARLTGEVDLSNAEQVYEQVLAAAQDAPLLLVELSGLGFIDSAGMAAMGRLARALSTGMTRLRIVARRDSVAARTLALAGMDRVLPISSEESAP